ncbi:MAG TPA: alpha/beta fold hydrolase [Ktedonobacteraceae bacterium]|jgi:pimeloyl-ACP methyl ester carboxylesterase
MQYHPPSNSEPDKMPTSARSEQENPAAHQAQQAYSEPMYQEFAPTGLSPDPVQQPPAAGAVPPSSPVYASASGAPPIQPGYTPSSPGYGAPAEYGTAGAAAQPGALWQTPAPGYIAQPGYVPLTPQPGYLPPGSGPAPFPGRPQRRRLSGLALTGLVAAAIIVLALVLGTISLARLGTNSTPLASGSTPAPQITSAPPTAQIGHPTSAFQAANCPFQPGAGVIDGQQVNCGYVTVPENRGTNNGQKVKLAVAIFKAPQYMNSIDPAPVLRLDGGPGGPSLDNWAHFVNSGDYSTLIFDHDVIMFDQRGTGYSTPSLKCPELIAQQSASSSTGGQTYQQAAHECYNRLTSQGIDLNGFNSLQNAADVADLIHALGYQQMTLYGVSYGTRLALTVMRLYPAVIHAAVLDSVYPTTHNRNDLPSDAQRVFSVLFEGCAKDTRCNAKYPHLQDVFYSLVDQLNAHPISFNTVDITTNQPHTIQFAGDDLVSFVFSTLYATSLIPQIPQTIFQIRAHQYTQLATIYGEIVFDDTFSDGMFYSAECSEDWPFLTLQDITTSEQGITPQIVKVFGQEDEQQEYAICQFWKVQRVPATQKQPVTSRVPTLIVTGEYDPITPPANGQEVARTLSQSYFFQFPGQGHGQQYSSGCSDQIISAFENNPAQQPDGSCIAQMTGPAFQ